MKDTQSWISEIDFQVENLKLNNRHAYYGFSLDMTKETAYSIVSYFENQNCQVEVSMCPRRQWDVIITW